MQINRSALSGALLAATLACAGLVATGCQKPTEKEKAAAPAPQPSKAAQAPQPAKEPIDALPLQVKVDQAKMQLGRRLYFDPILSGDGTVSCATCHSLDKGGADGRKTSLGIGGQVGPINAPTVLNSSLNLAQFWDGRAADLQDQAKGPVANPKEMGATWDEVAERLKADKDYAKEFAAVYKDGVTENNVVDAIAEYEKALITPSPFDAYLRGDQSAISDQAKKGYALFKQTGCTTCHNGEGVGGNSFQKLGVVHDYFADRGGAMTDADMGRYNVTKKDEDKHKFKVPTLRNVALTAPYFHDGSKANLHDAIHAMGYYQLGKDLSDDQIALIQAFLQSLTGKIPADAYLPKDQPIPDRGYLGKGNGKSRAAPKKPI